MGSGEDMRGRAVILFQPHHLGLGPVVGEAQDVGHLGATPTVDALVVVTHHAQVLVPLGQGMHDAILQTVGVLVFVDQQVVESRRLGEARVGVLEEKLLRQQQQVVEVDSAGGFQRSLVFGVGQRSQKLLVAFGHGLGLRGANRAAFPRTDDG